MDRAQIVNYLHIQLYLRQGQYLHAFEYEYILQTSFFMIKIQLAEIK